MFELMLKKAIENSGVPPKAIAAETKYSVDAFYAACRGKRGIPLKAKQKLAMMNLLAGMAIALEATGYEIFTYIDRDRHIQTMIRRVEKEDAEADKALGEVPWRLIDKQQPEDLTEEDKFALKAAAKEIGDRIRADINLLIEWDDRYRLCLTEMILRPQKEKDRFQAAK